MAQGGIINVDFFWARVTISKIDCIHFSDHRILRLIDEITITITAIDRVVTAIIIEIDIITRAIFTLGMDYVFIGPRVGFVIIGEGCIFTAFWTDRIE